MSDEQLEKEAKLIKKTIEDNSNIEIRLQEATTESPYFLSIFLTD